ncbi:MAG: sugar transferase [Pseudomonadales bacterium]
MDLIVSSMLLLLCAPLIIACLLIIPLESQGPALFKQRRVGKGGKIFTLYKFRSMTNNAISNEELEATQKSTRVGIAMKFDNDPRITRVGRLIRKFSIDELPQLINVFQGNMSLIGPRPALPSETAQYTLYQRQRLTTMPGISGLWQVSGRSALNFEQQVALDIQYGQESNLWMDLKITFLTMLAVLLAKGAN